MNEPRLEDIDDYNTLKGEKRKVVFAVIIAGLILGVIYVIVDNINKPNDSIVVEKQLKNIPMK